MSKGNPFILSSGKVPHLYIDRLMQKNKIIEDFCDEMPSNQIYMLTGIRGCGKTVMMTDIERQLEATGDFVILNLSIDGDLVEEWAGGLYDHPMMKRKFLDLKLDFSLLGIGASIEKSEPVSDISTAIRKMLDVVRKAKKKLLIAIDEAVNSEEMKRFGSLFSIFLRTDYPVYLIMTGLPQNIYSVINSKTLTFLTRAPRIVLEPINYTLMRNAYKEVFKISKEESENMAVLTKGYSFGFQLLGYLLWERRMKKPDASFKDILDEYDARLAEGAYDKIWQDMSESDIILCKAMVRADSGSISNIRNEIGCSSQSLNNYKNRLVDRGIINVKGHGYIEFSLPRFKEYVLEQISMAE
ncbi:MAG: ATP-binding protein [Lachnospiraceae bacterium]|nr:ATP-binding protein [Lachnospiraceae bacterium]